MEKSGPRPGTRRRGRRAKSLAQEKFSGVAQAGTAARKEAGAKADFGWPGFRTSSSRYRRRLMRICQATTPRQIAQARCLFEEYATWLGIDLSFQGFAAE